MVSIVDLWQPILLSAIIVFVVSWILNVFAPHHRGDYVQAPDEEAALAALRQLNLPAGDYYVPRAADMQSFRDPAFLARMKQGPVALLRIRPGRTPSMNRELLQWFVFLLVVGISAAYLAGRTLAAGSDYLTVFRVAGFVAFVAYGYGQAIESIWYARKWRSTLAALADALVYALLTGGVFGWLWPHAAQA